MRRGGGYAPLYTALFVCVDGWEVNTCFSPTIFYWGKQFPLPFLVSLPFFILPSIEMHIKLFPCES